MEITASRFKLRANAPERQKAISYRKRFPIRIRQIDWVRSQVLLGNWRK